MQILVLDDHRLFLDGLRHVLQQLDENVSVTEAQTTQRALDMIDQGGYFDLILSDITLPGMDGFAFLSALRERRVSAPVVVVSGVVDARSIRRALDGGALGFIPKSLGARELINALQQVLQGEVFIPPDFRQAVLEARAAPGPTIAATGIGPRQMDVLRLLAEGKSNKQIASILNIAEATVKTHISALFKAMNVSNRTSCVHEATQLGLL